MQVALSMILALAMILFGAELFTNAVEWLGHKLHLSQGAVGSILAALGTALPETAVPVTAILLGQGSHEAQEVGIGGILGAPFLLATLGSLVMAVSLVATRRLHPSYTMHVQRIGFQRDLSFFILAYGMAMVSGCIGAKWVHDVVPILLVSTYVVFLFLTLKDKEITVQGVQLHPLYLQWKLMEPAMFWVGLQLLCALAAIVGGAQLLTSGVEKIAVWIQIPPFVLSALLIPLTTELPETFNSVVWIRQGKDALALGNITGAMVFQSTLVPALGIWLTPWNLNPEALLTGGLTLAAAALIFGMYRLQGTLSPGPLFAASFLYWILPIQAIAVRYQASEVFWWGTCVIAVAFMLSIRFAARFRNA